jgi:hypothetical protein
MSVAASGAPADEAAVALVAVGLAGARALAFARLPRFARDRLCLRTLEAVVLDDARPAPPEKNRQPTRTKPHAAAEFRDPVSIAIHRTPVATREGAG